ncbi:alpha/beta hydrolase [Flagellimonas nanhaiensis]|uniref:Alpha/beta fold hydrolase n=1 Tax=Flagellimonas nanhaiensis TaxID=2292706 RepID=A0A371JNH8_9FLAO|nr:alpha/beta fold hydrolase [Allomuricauda nanhaiensis]RDY58777.1 alpha/beta fold hydrolase [Allomuricauda nanhaiensis]
MKLISRFVKGLLIVLIILIVLFFVGPRVEKPNLDRTLPEVNTNLEELEDWINNKEKTVPNIKSNNEARIVWFDSIPSKTEYSIVYLHGWSASQMEGHPLHTDIAKKYGCNLYLPRLAGHGLDEEEAMLNLTADMVLDSAKEAIAVAKQLGDKVIVMATSTGGTLALHLVGGDKDIVGLLLYSPNIEIYDKNAKLLTGPWGLQLAKMVKKSDYHEFDANEEKKKYWTTKYRVEALTHLQAMVDNTMKPETFQKVEQPVFMGYFYKNDSIQDKVVSVAAMLKMFDELGTPQDKKRKKAFPETGDHVMTSYVTSKDLESVQTETENYLEEIIGLEKVTFLDAVGTKAEDLIRM